MKKSIFLLLPLLTLSCGGNSGDWTTRPLNVPANATLETFLADAAGLSGLSFTIAPELQEALNENPVDLPILSGTTAAQSLTLVQDTMPPETAFVYEKLEDGNFVLNLRYEETEDLNGGDAVTVVDFDTGLGTKATSLVSDPVFDEECGGEVENILTLLGDGGVFDITTEIESDPGGHTEFIGEFPPSVEVAIAGHDITVTGVAPWVGVTGTIAEDGSFTCGGSGTVAGFPDVSVTFEGTAAPSGLTGTLTVGAGGELPGGDAAVYAVHP